MQIREWRAGWLPLVARRPGCQGCNKAGGISSPPGWLNFIGLYCNNCANWTAMSFCWNMGQRAEWRKMCTAQLDFLGTALYLAVLFSFFVNLTITKFDVYLIQLELSLGKDSCLHKKAFALAHVCLQVVFLESRSSSYLHRLFGPDNAKWHLLHPRRTKQESEKRRKICIRPYIFALTSER